MSANPSKKIANSLKRYIKSDIKFYKDKWQKWFNAYVDAALNILENENCSGVFSINLKKEVEKDWLKVAEQIIGNMYVQNSLYDSDNEFLNNLYGTDLPEDIKAKVLLNIGQVKCQQQGWKLSDVYPIVFIETVKFEKIDKKVQILTGIRKEDDETEILSCWINDESDKQFWVKVFTDLQLRGVEDILILIRDENPAITVALNKVFPMKGIHLSILKLFNDIIYFHGIKEIHIPISLLRGLISDPEGGLAYAFYNETRNYIKNSPSLKGKWKNHQQQIREFFLPFFADLQDRIFINEMLYRSVIFTQQK